MVRGRVPIGGLETGKGKGTQIRAGAPRAYGLTSAYTGGIRVTRGGDNTPH